LPLLISPVLAAAVAAALYLVLRWQRLRLGITKEWCLCVGGKQQVVPIPQPGSALALQRAPALEVFGGTESNCSERYAGTYLGLNCQMAMDAAHFLSAGVVSFARGLNDTPKLAALLLVLPAINIEWGSVAVAVAIAVGGLLSARKVAETMSHKITGMNHGQAFAANLTTGLLVILASQFGLPVSTTHVSVGALFGIGLTTRKANPRVVGGVVLSWVLTLPCAALIGGLAYWVATHL